MEPKYVFVDANALFHCNRGPRYTSDSRCIFWLTARHLRLPLVHLPMGMREVRPAHVFCLYALFSSLLPSSSSPTRARATTQGVLAFD